MADANDRTERDGRGVGLGGVGGGVGVGPAADPAHGLDPDPDPDAIRERVAAVYERHGAELRRFVLGVVRDPDVTEDVMQATLSKALEAGHAARPDRLKPWLFRVAFHEALAVRRRRRAGETAARRLADLGRAATSGGSGSGSGPDARLIRGETVAAVRKALDTLPEEQRRVVVARVYEGQTFARIAGDANLPLGTVLTRMRLALDKLRRALGPPGDPA